MINKWINKKMTCCKCANLIYKMFHGEDRIILVFDPESGAHANNFSIDTACEIRKTLLSREIFDDQDKEYFFTVGKVLIG